MRLAYLILFKLELEETKLTRDLRRLGEPLAMGVHLGNLKFVQSATTDGRNILVVWMA